MAKKEKKKENYKFILIMTFFILFVVSLISIGYSSFQTEFAIDGSMMVRSNTDVRVTAISVASTNLITQNTSPSYNARNIYDSVTLNSSLSSIVYNITVTNFSSSDALLTSITKKTWNNSEVVYTLSGITLNETVIKPTASLTFQITLNCQLGLIGGILGSFLPHPINFVLDFEFYKTPKYALDITSVPNDALIVYEANGEIVSTGTGNLSASFSSGTSVRWIVSKSGYATESGTETITSNISKEVTLIQASDYNFTVTPSPNDALVSIYANGILLQSGYGAQTVNTTTGTILDYTVSKFLYQEASGSYTMGTSNYNVNVTLTSLPPAPNNWYTALNPTLLYKLRTNEVIGTPSTQPGSGMSSSSEKVFASSNDDYGTTYYYRGAVTNNYVVFAGMCWRIVRVTGDGSIKLVLYNSDGTSCTSTGNSLAFSSTSTAYNTTITNNAYIGFMYGSVSSGATYLQTHENITKSNILNTLETWYTVKFVDTGLESKLADVIWCNDKTLSSSSTGTGANTSKNTYYSPYLRIFTNKTATLMCPTDNSNLSRFTVNDTVNGNGVLDKKIGLLTADEVAFAGSSKYTTIFNTNKTYYLYQNATSGYWWVMSPYYYPSGGARMFSVSGSGYLNATDADEAKAVRPSIALNPTVEVSSGIGTADSPYVIN